LINNPVKIRRKGGRAEKAEKAEWQKGRYAICNGQQAMGKEAFSFP
jgi:hypothetical protein